LVGIRTRKAVCFVIFIIMIFLLLGLDRGWTESEQPHLIAPGGAEIDFVNNLTKCFGTDTKPVEAYWKNYSVEAYYLEYNRDNDMVQAHNKVRILQNIPVYRVVTCNDFLVELKREFIKAENEVKIVYDENTSLTGDALEWDRQNDLVKVTGTPQIDFKDWRINGERIEGQINKGIFIIFGPVKGIGNDESFQAGQVVFDHIRDKIFLKNNPVVIQGKNQFTAPEIVYDLNTRKISTKSDLRMN